MTLVGKRSDTGGSANPARRQRAPARALSAIVRGLAILLCVAVAAAGAAALAQRSRSGHWLVPGAAYCAGTAGLVVLSGAWAERRARMVGGARSAPDEADVMPRSDDGTDQWKEAA